VALGSRQKGGGPRKVHQSRGIEDQEETILQHDDSGHQLANDCRHSRRRPLERVTLELENVADLVDEQADCAVGGTDHDVHGPLVVGSRRQIEAVTEIVASLGPLAERWQPVEQSSARRHCRAHASSADSL